ncbi:uncharacterized protein LOC101778035 [Setaria italica]|uniref:uncharacterized protein LOC101778035 n=1 Tax=Setaria italica TaxID=4555 RepID=UPI000350D525|nr:uncharacterized protein LOC101778035 [Setaria italica]
MRGWRLGATVSRAVLNPDCAAVASKSCMYRYSQEQASCPFLLAAASAASLLSAPASAADAHAPASDSAAYASARDAAARCAATIVSISPCLPHVAAVAPPLATSPPAPTDACCVAFLRAVYPSGGSGGEGCLCHLLRNPLLLGFPVDAARLGALLPTCAAGNSFAAATVEAATLFADACRGA